MSFDPLLKNEKLDTGVHPSLTRDRIPFWEECRNIQFADGAIQPYPGQIALVQKVEVAPVMGMFETEIDEIKTLFWGTLEKLYRYLDGQSAVDVTRTSGGDYGGNEDESFATGTGITTPATRWSFASWGRRPVATNGLTKPQQFNDGTSKFVDMDTDDTGGAGAGAGDDEFTTAEIAIPFTPYLIMMNTSGGTNGDEKTVHWCSANNTADWIPIDANDAGLIQVREIESEIRAAVPLGPAIAFYGANSMHAMSFIGAPLVFAVRRLLGGVGAVSKHSVVRVGRLHYGFGPRGIWRTDGIQFDYIDTPSIRDFIREDLNINQLSKVWAWHDPLEQTVTFWYCTVDSTAINRGVAYRYATGAWSIIDFARTAGTTANVFDYPITGDGTGNILLQSTTQSVISSPDDPLQLPAAFNLNLGYGEGGYGGSGYGGVDSGDG